MVTDHAATNHFAKMRLGAATAALAFVVTLVLPVTTPSAQAQTFTDLYNFTGSPDGGYPRGGLVQDTAGNLYGTTYAGGSSNNSGTVFKVSNTGKETVLHSFTGGSSDGAYPSAGLILDAAGNLYGTTGQGGASGVGTVFKVSKTGKETVLYNFAGGSSDGCYPYGGLVRDPAGNFYGTTEACGTSGYGTVFKLSKSRKETVLHSFTGGSSDGAYPYFTGLFMDPKGNLYGVTYDGGASSKGVVYKLRKSGAFTLLHSFAGGKTDGCYATGAPAMDTTGNLYGTTHACGSSNLGIVWKLSEKGAETVLHNFGPSDAEYPFAGVIMDANGNLYGETSFGGPYGAGTVFELNQMGTLTLLHSFLSSSDGAVPEGGLIRDVQGNFYGTAFYGGSDGYGTVWKLTP